MGKKGAKRKTRWRSLSIGAPPGEEDEEEEVHNGYQMENRNGSVKSERNAQGGYSSYKRTRPYNGGNTNTYGYGYGSLYNGQSKASQPKDEDPTKPKIVFNEEEYMRITTPRQDVLFKKGYLSRKKPLASTASTSATSATTTPSTNESQSAAHSTADGSETAEDQQLLDASSGGEFAIVPESAAQFAYGGFYDQVTGYYYEYPVMLVGPPVPGHPSPNVLAAMSCGPVPLRPVEWFNPQFMPEPLQEQHPLPNSTDSQAGSCGSSVSMDEVGATGTPAHAEIVNSGEAKEEEAMMEDGEAAVIAETTTESEPTAQIIPQIVPHMHMAPQHYIYPGHFMFGPPMMNMNGVTIQNGAIIPSEALWAKRRKKKKRRKQRRPLAVGNTEDEEEEYSSEWESGSNWSQPAACSTSTTAAEATNDVVTSRPLNPEVQEFRFRARLSVLPDATDAADTTDTSDTVLDTKDVDGLSALQPGEQKEENCENTDADNEDRIGSSDAANLSSNLNANSKDKSNENTFENERVAETNKGDERLPDLVETLQVDRNGEVISGELGTELIASDQTNEIKEIILNNDDDKPIAENNFVSESSDTREVPNGIWKENNVNHSNGVKSDVEILDNIIVEVIGEDSNEDRELIALRKSVDLSGEVDHNNKNNFDDKKDIEESVEPSGPNTNSLSSETNEFNSSPVSDSNKKPDDETSNNKKGGNKGVKKGKGKAMDAKKPARNKREARNPQRNDTVTTTTTSLPRDSSQETESSPSSEAKPPVDSESSKLSLPLTKPSSRPTSPEINQTTTPINADINRLPGSYESSVARSTSASTTSSPISGSAPVAPPRRKYSAKGLKFVREPTPGPDLDTEIKSDNEEAIRIGDHLKSEECRKVEGTTSNDQKFPKSNENAAVTQGNNEDEQDKLFTVVSGEPDDKNSVSRIEDRSEERIADEEECSKAEPKSEIGNLLAVNNSDNHENEDVGTESKLSDHPITDAVTAWLERTKSPEIFRIPMPIPDSDDDSDLSEVEIHDGDPKNIEPSKNLKGNPMPALSVSNGSIDDLEKTRSNVVTSGNFTKTDTFDTSNTIKRRREKDIDHKKQISPTNEGETTVEEISRSVKVCQIANEGRAAGMRVAENSRVILNRLNTEERRFDDHGRVNHVENIEMEIKSNVAASNGDFTENGIEALEHVKTYERGEIVVLDGKLLTGTIYEPTCSKQSNLQSRSMIDETSESNNNQRETSHDNQRSIKLDEQFTTRGSNSEHEMSPEGTINSLGSIEEPDVLECWETEIIEPVIILKNNGNTMKLQVDGEIHDGEATEEENYENCKDPATREHVKKYYRLAREYTLSVDDELSEKAAATSRQTNAENVTSSVSNSSPQRTTPNTPERMIECLCSEEIPIIMPVKNPALTKASNAAKDGKDTEPVDEAYEVYESCYNSEKTRLSGMSRLNVEGSKTPFQNQEGPIPCKAVCCNIQ